MGTASTLAPSKRLRKLEAAREHLRQARNQLRDLHDDNMARCRAGEPAPRCATDVATTHDAVRAQLDVLGVWASSASIMERVGEPSAAER